MTQRQEALSEMKTQLSSMKENNRNQIHLITLIADDYGEFADGIVQEICKHIRDLPNDKKLLGIYVMDSILKFNGDNQDKYRSLFGKEFVELFIDTLTKVPITTRYNLFKVRSTWQTFFPKHKLYELDLKAKEFDKSWPIFKDPKTQPQPPPAATPATTAPTQPPAAPAPQPTAVAAVNQQPASRPTAPPPASKPAAPTSQPAATAVAKPSQSQQKQTPPPAQAPKPEVKKPEEKQKKDEPKQQPKKVVQIPEPAPRKVPEQAPKKQPEPAPVVKPKEAPKPKPSAAPAPKVVKSEPVGEEHGQKPRPLLPSPPKSILVKKNKPDGPASASASTSSNTSSIQKLPQNPADRSISPKNDKRKSKKRSDRRHKSPDRPEKKRRTDYFHASATEAVGSHAFITNPALSVNTNMPVVPGPLMAPVQRISPTMRMPMQPIKMEVEESWRRPNGFQQNNMPIAPMSSVITNETPRIGSAGNNRIFVMGRAYEVHYIHNEAVIEQNGLPHRIYFAGPPRDILIDNKPFRMSFEDVRMINIDGVPHPIRFGAPSRELYIGDTPFRGAFGGPPMIANINGRKHELKLCGPPPEVRIDKDPCYELSVQMGKIRDMPANPAPENISDKVNNADVQKLLQRIKQTGILNVIKAGTSATAAALDNAAKKSQGFSDPSPPIRMEISRMDSAPQALKDFQINALMVRYKDNVEALHQSRTACTHCGISFPDTKSEAYHRHIDSHIKELLQAKESNKANYKPFFMSLDEWMVYDELDEVLNANAPEAAKHNVDNVEASPEDSASGSPSDPIANANLNKICSVCHEKFIEYYDNDEDEWRFRDCVIKGSSAVHRYCLEQLGDESEVKMETESMPQQQALV